MQGPVADHAAEAGGRAAGVAGVDVNRGVAAGGGGTALEPAHLGRVEAQGRGGRADAAGGTELKLAALHHQGGAAVPWGVVQNRSTAASEPQAAVAGLQASHLDVASGAEADAALADQGRGDRAAIAAGRELANAAIANADLHRSGLDHPFKVKVDVAEIHHQGTTGVDMAQHLVLTEAQIAGAGSADHALKAAGSKVDVAAAGAANGAPFEAEAAGGDDIGLLIAIAGKAAESIDNGAAAAEADLLAAAAGAVANDAAEQDALVGGQADRTGAGQGAPAGHAVTATDVDR